MVNVPQPLAHLDTCPCRQVHHGHSRGADFAGDTCHSQTQGREGWPGLLGDGGPRHTTYMGVTAEWNGPDTNRQADIALNLFVDLLFTSTFACLFVCLVVSMPTYSMQLSLQMHP